jgi:hypothetical protein
MKRGKIDERKAGPFKISWAGKRACTSEGIPAGYHHTFHVSLLEPYKRGNKAPPPIKLPPLENNQAHYTPKKIIAYGEENNETLFLIAWKGYPLDEATWEPFESLYPGSEQLLQQFYNKNPQVTPHKEWPNKKRKNPDISILQPEAKKLKH